DGARARAQRRAGAEGGPPARKARGPRGKAPANLTVTLAYADGEWTVAAAQGAKTLARPYVVKPGEALRMVSLVDVPGVQEAVEQILSAERAEGRGRRSAWGDDAWMDTSWRVPRLWRFLLFISPALVFPVCRLRVSGE